MKRPTTPDTTPEAVERIRKYVEHPYTTRNTLVLDSVLVAITAGDLADLLSERDALSEELGQARAVEVKPLEWHLIEQPTQWARNRHVAQIYIIEHRLHGDHFDLWIGHNATSASRFNTLDDAKAAAQSHHNARVLAMLDMGEKK